MIEPNSPVVLRIDTMDGTTSADMTYSEAQAEFAHLVAQWTREGSPGKLTVLHGERMKDVRTLLHAALFWPPWAQGRES